MENNYFQTRQHSELISLESRLINDLIIFFEMTNKRRCRWKLKLKCALINLKKPWPSFSCGQKSGLRNISQLSFILHCDFINNKLYHSRNDLKLFITVCKLFPDNNLKILNKSFAHFDLFIKYKNCGNTFSYYIGSLNK